VECPETYAGKFGTPVVVFIEGSACEGLVKVGIFSIQQLIAASIITIFSKAIFLASAAKILFHK
jgi:hypothetical protein